MDTDLKPFEGREVSSTSIRITNAGDGLSEALEIDPLTLRIGERVYVVLECDVSKIRHEPRKAAKGEESDPTDLVRVQILRASAATLVDKELVGDAIAAQKDRIQAAKDAAAGQERLDLEAEEQRLADDEDDD